MDFKSKLIYYYLLTKTKILIWFSSLRRLITDTKRITANTNTSTKSIYFRYLVVRSLKYLISLIDVTSKKIEITKDYVDGEITAILDANVAGKENISIYDTICHIDDYKNKTTNGETTNRVFLKLLLKNKDDSICLKDYLIKYRDDEEKYHNTLENIIDMNNIDVCEETSQINMVFFNQGKRQSSSIPYKDCKGELISYFNKIEN